MVTKGVNMLTVEQINQINSVLGNDKLLNKINRKIASLKKQMAESIEDHRKDLEQAEEALEAAISDANSYGKECYHDLKNVTMILFMQQRNMMMS
jgi:predicted ArsR family transcriptional regulator